MEEQPALPELLPGLIEAVTTVARLDLPDAADIYYYRNMPEYKEVNTACSSQIEQLLRTAHTNLTRPTASSAGVLQQHDEDDLEEALYENVVSILDDTMERLDTALDAAKQQTEQFKLGGWAPAVGSRQIFRGIARGQDYPGASAGFSRGRIQRHVANLPRPQDVFPDPVDNSNTPWSPSRFSHLAPKLAEAAAQPHRDRLQAHAAQLAAASRTYSSGTASTTHPYASELSALSYQSWQIEDSGELTAAADLDATPFEFIDTPDQLSAMVDALRGEPQIALDLEHHSYRSFQGFSCLLQLSTRSHDYVVDCLSLRGQLGPALADILADPTVEKVLHGADSDVMWLQRDFGLYIVNLFDTGQAARVLNYPSASLAYLLERHAGFKADKRYQLADWRVRPLSADMLHYARCDTHFLLSVADQLKKELIAAGDRTPAGLSVNVPHTAGTGQTALGVVLERSRQLCLQTYQKPLFTEHSYLEQAGRWQLNLPPKNMAVFAALFAWRDRTARALDESVSYVMPKASLIELSRAAPQTVTELRKLLGAASGLSGSSGLLLQRADEVVQVIVNGQQQATLRVAPPSAAAEASSSQHTAPAAAAEVAQAAVKPRELPALKPKSVTALAPKKASGMKGILGAGKQHGAAAAAVPVAGQPAPTGTGLQPAHTDALQQQVGQQSGQAQLLKQHQPQQQQSQQQQQQQQQPAVNVLPVDGAVHQQQQQQHSEAQTRNEQQQPLAQAFLAAAPVKQVAAVISKKRSGSSLAALLSSKARLNHAPQQQQQPFEHIAAGIKAESFRLPFMAAVAAGSAAAVESGTSQSVAHDSSMQQQQQQQQQAAESEVAEAPAAAVTGAEIRAVIDELFAETDDDTQAQQSQDEDTEEPAEAANRSGGSVLADMDYVPLSAQIQKKKKYNHKSATSTQQQQQQPHKHQPAPVDDQQPAAKRVKISSGTHPAAEAPGAQVHTQRKRGGIFADAMMADSDDSSSSDDGSDDGLLPSYDPSGTKKPVSAAQDSQLQHGTSTTFEANPGVDQGSVRGRGQRGGRGGDRGRGRSKRGGFMAAATASLAAVRAKQGGGGVGANPFALPDTGLVRGGKRSAVAPRGGNRSATFK